MQYRLYDTIEGATYGPFDSEREAYTTGVEMDIAIEQLTEDDAIELLDLIDAGDYTELNAAWWDVRPTTGPGSRRKLAAPC